MNQPYAKPTVVASVCEAIEHTIDRADADIDHDLPSGGGSSSRDRNDGRLWSSALKSTR